MRTVRNLLVTLALVAAALPAPALASGDDVIRDCAADGVIDGSYSDSELRQAERNLPSDIDEYTDCREAIRGALGGGSGRPGGGRKPTDPSLVTPDGAVASTREDIGALNKLRDRRGPRGRAPSLDVGGTPVTPGQGGKLLGVASGSNDMPASMLSALGLLVLLALTGTVLLVRRRGLPAPVAARLGRLRGRAPGAPSLLTRVRLPRIFRR